MQYQEALRLSEKKSAGPRPPVRIPSCVEPSKTPVPT
jgi:hypothetical protein